MTVDAARADHVRDWVLDDRNLSEQQRAAVTHDGDFFLAACPGAGKTRTVGVRLAWWSVNPDEIDETQRFRRVAALSYTNVAIEEIARAATAAGSPVRSPHFLGTIHRFMLRYVVRPFGMTVMGCAAPPRLVVSSDGRTEQVTFKERLKGYSADRSVSIWDLHWRADGSLALSADADVLYQTSLPPEAVVARVATEAMALKNRLAADGLISMSDAMYWAMKALEVDENAAAVAARFDELVVDEVQDTTDTQLECLKRLKTAGLRSIALVGDPNQAIFEFAGAEPERLYSTVGELGLAQLDLTENWRSSQRICDVAGRFRASGGSDKAVSERKSLPHQPELIIYEADNVRHAVDQFEVRLKSLKLDMAHIGIFCRGRQGRDAVNGTGGGIFNGRLADLAEIAAVKHGHTPGRDLIAEAEADLIRHAWPQLLPDQIGDERRRRVRTALFVLSETLPDPSLQAREWCAGTRTLVNDAIDDLRDADGGTPLKWKANAPRGTGDIAVSALLSGRRTRLRAQTIHAVKGESHDATLTVAAKPGYFDNAADWLRGDGEERRIAYVALTRARQYCALALPDSCTGEQVSEFRRRGFVLV